MRTLNGKRESPLKKAIKRKSNKYSRKAVRPADLPSSDAIWTAYSNVNYVMIPPDKNGQVWALIGGNIGATFGPQNANTCATRLSYGLNYGGAPIPNSAQGGFGASKNFTTEQYNGVPGDGKNYIVSAANMQKYLKSTWGNPNQTLQTEDDLKSLTANLSPGQSAVFATGGPAGQGHAGMIKAGYQDPYIVSELPVDVWILPV